MFTCMHSPLFNSILCVLYIMYILVKQSSLWYIECHWIRIAYEIFANTIKHSDNVLLPIIRMSQ